MQSIEFSEEGRERLRSLARERARAAERAEREALREMMEETDADDAPEMLYLGEDLGEESF
jgi:predicted transcriptional regulator